MTKAELLVGNVPTRDTHRFDVLVTKIGSDVITHNPARRELVDSVISSLSDEFVRPHNGEEVAILFDGVEHFLSRPNAFNFLALLLRTAEEAMVMNGFKRFLEEGEKLNEADAWEMVNRFREFLRRTAEEEAKSSDTAQPSPIPPSFSADVTLHRKRQRSRRH